MSFLDDEQKKNHNTTMPYRHAVLEEPENEKVLDGLILAYIQNPYEYKTYDKMTRLFIDVANSKGTVYSEKDRIAQMSYYLTSMHPYISHWTEQHTKKFMSRT